MCFNGTGIWGGETLCREKYSTGMHDMHERHLCVENEIFDTVLDPCHFRLHYFSFRQHKSQQTRLFCDFNNH